MTQELYRIHIEGDSPWYSKVEFASGWIPARAGDLLTGSLEPAVTSNSSTTGQPTPDDPRLRAARRFFEVGPLGVSYAPADWRLAVVMSANPDQFFVSVQGVA